MTAVLLGAVCGVVLVALELHRRREMDRWEEFLRRVPALLHNTPITAAPPDGQALDMHGHPMPTEPLPVRRADEPIVAWRRWFVATGPVQLLSLNTWIWRGPIVSTAKPVDAIPPGPFIHRDGAGIHAFVDRDTARGTGKHPYGRVELLGRVVRHGWGYRAEKARVTKIIFPARYTAAVERSGVDTEAIRQQLEAKYQCDVEIE